jgi:hypothetical protein
MTMTRSLRIFYRLFLVPAGPGRLVGAQLLRLQHQRRRPCSTALDQGRRDPLRRAPIKRLGTNLWAALDFKLFNEGRPGVVLGRDQWLYSDEEFNPIVNEELNLQGNYALVEGVRQTLKAQGVQLVLASCRPRHACTRNTSAK